MCPYHVCMCPCREDHENEYVLRLPATGEGESQQLTSVHDNPALLTANNTGQQILTISENSAYATVDEHTQQPMLQSSHAYVSAEQ